MSFHSPFNFTREQGYSTPRVVSNLWPLHGGHFDTVTSVTWLPRLPEAGWHDKWVVECLWCCVHRLARGWRRACQRGCHTAPLSINTGSGTLAKIQLCSSLSRHYFAVNAGVAYSACCSVAFVQLLRSFLLFARAHRPLVDKMLCMSENCWCFSVR